MGSRSQNFIWFFKCTTDSTDNNFNGTSTVLTNGGSKLLANGKPVLNCGPKSLRKYSPDWNTLDICSYLLIVSKLLQYHFPCWF